VRVIFFGTPELAARCLDGLLAAGDRHPVVAVVTQPDRPAGRSGRPQPPPTKVLAERHALPVQQPQSIRTRDFREQLARTGAEIGVVVAYGKILGPRLLAAVPRGFVNVHASLLPRWRGASPIQAAIRAGDPDTGVTTMQMDTGLDTGPMLLWEQVTLRPRETAGSLHDRLAELAALILPATLDQLEAGTLEPTPQEHSPFGPPSTCTLIRKEDGAIDWGRDADEVDRHVRAMVPWPGAFTTLGGLRLLVLEATPEPAASAAPPGTVLVASGAELRVACGSGALAIHRLQRSGKRACSTEAFLRGQSVAVGARCS
jgi:methionyl-tRNA formyltransferase